MGVFGQDWASYQSTSLPTAGLGFVVIKQTEGLGYTNPRAVAQVAHARAHGLVVGHYHYPHMANSARAEADRFLTIADPQPGDFLVLDWEGYDASNKPVPFSTQVAYKKAWLAHVQAARPTMQTGTYANTDYLNRDPAGTYGDFLWIATANKPAGMPGIAHPWLFHQYGAAGIDRDYCPLTLDDLKAWTHAKEPQPLEDDVSAMDVLTYRNKTADDASVKAGHGHIPDFYGYVVQTNAEVKAMHATIAAMVPLIGKNVDTQTVVKAVQDAIAAATVHVSVDVTGDTAA